jgi:hypothetical protein
LAVNANTFLGRKFHVKESAYLSAHILCAPFQASKGTRLWVTIRKTLARRAEVNCGRRPFHSSSVFHGFISSAAMKDLWMPFVSGAEGIAIENG